MPSMFEKAPTQDAQAAHSMMEALVSSLQEAETVFVPLGPETSTRYRCRRRGLFVDLSWSRGRGIVTLDVPLGVTIGERDAVALRACASFYEEFRYETGTFVAMRGEEPSEWGEGAEIHLVLEQLMGSKGADDLVNIAACQAREAREGFLRIAGGSGLAEAAASDDDD